MNEAVQEFWNAFLEIEPELAKDTPFQTWHFGNTPEMAGQLASLVIHGKKVATASLEAVNEIKPDEAPIDDGYSVITTYDGNPICVIQTVEIELVPFKEVDEQFAFDEGEGDQTLDYWRDVHNRYFTVEAAELGLEFSKSSIICCERFRLVYPR